MHTDARGGGGDGDRLTILAHAKVNLTLEILLRRADGYHEIRSLLAPIALFDRLTLERAPDGVIETHTVNVGGVNGGAEELVASDQNLATRVARGLREQTGVKAGVRIRVEKSIPVGGGLGGGSADAAATLLGLNRFWGVGLSRAQLMVLGGGVGCDVPALVHGGMVCMEGLGERISPVEAATPAAEVWLAIVNPCFHVSTRDIYSRCNSSLTSGVPFHNSMLLALKAGDLEQVGRSLYNGLEPSVFRKYPLIEIIVDRLKAAGALGVLLCGSGSSVFALARSQEHAGGLLSRLAAGLGHPVWGRMVRLLPDGVMVAHGPLEA